METPVRLTQTVQKGGCAAKVAAHELRNLLSGVDFPPRVQGLLVDGSHFDDAAVLQVTPDLALVQTLDFFTPVLDSPRSFGRVAAANALSDIYAMGGEAQSALAILAYPIASMKPEVVREVLQGACDVLKEAGASLVGGHSIDDDTLKFGLSAHGVVSPKKVWSNRKAQPGDVLILTKALGTGTLCAGLKRGLWSEEDMKEAVESMGTLNRVRDLLGDLEDQVHAATDVTGFGLLGHGLHLALGSELTLEFEYPMIPLFPRVLEALAEGCLTKAHRTNAEYLGTRWRVEGKDLEGNARLTLFDPQTSGGLLLCVDEKSADQVVSRLKARFPRTTRVGQVSARRETEIVVRNA